jgi:hypothetical protein
LISTSGCTLNSGGFANSGNVGSVAVARITSDLAVPSLEQGCQIIFLGTTFQKTPKRQQNFPNDNKIFQMTTKFSKWQQNVPNDHKMCKLNGRKLYQNFTIKAFQNKKMGFFGMKIYQLAALVWKRGQIFDSGILGQSYDLCTYDCRSGVVMILSVFSTKKINICSSKNIQGYAYVGYQFFTLYGSQNWVLVDKKIYSNRYIGYQFLQCIQKMILWTCNSSRDRKEQPIIFLFEIWA